jgi:NDP-sugar pyrophosphorylase family protein
MLKLQRRSIQQVYAAIFKLAQAVVLKEIRGEVLILNGDIVTNDYRQLLLRLTKNQAYSDIMIRCI